LGFQTLTIRRAYRTSDIRLRRLTRSLTEVYPTFYQSGTERPIPVDGGDTWYVLLVADGVRQKSVADLPSKHRGVLPLILADRLDDPRRRDLGLAAADHARFDRAGLVVPAEHTTQMRDTGARHHSIALTYSPS